MFTAIAQKKYVAIDEKYICPPLNQSTCPTILAEFSYKQLTHKVGIRAKVV